MKGANISGMEERSWQLLRLLSQEKYHTAGQLAEQVGVSEKTVRNRMKLLGDELKENGAVLESRSGSGYRLCIQDPQKYEAWQEGEQQLLWAEQLPETTSGRVNYLLDFLLQADDYVKIDDLCEKLYVSRNTLAADIKAVRETLEVGRLRLCSKPGSGIRIEGGEFERRNLMVRRMLYHSRLSAQGPLPETLRKPLVQTLYTMLKENRLRMQDDALEELLLYIAMMIQRIADGHEMKVPAQGLLSVPDAMQPEADTVADALEEHFGIRCNTVERMALAVHLAGKAQSYSQHTMNTNAVQLHQSQLVDLMLKKVQQANGLDYTQDEELHEAILQHLGPMDVRMKYNIPMENPLLSEIRRDYALAFTVACSACSVLQEYYQKPIPEDEIGYMAVLFALAMEKKKHTLKKKNVVVVCATGRASARLFLYRYQQLFGEMIDQMYDCPSFELEEFDFVGKKIDYVFTTVPLTIKLPVPVFQVSILLEEDDIQNCQKLLQSEDMGFLRSYFRPELFVAHLAAETREQVLQQMCQLAHRYFDLPDAFYGSVLQREELAPTDFGNYTAIPHSLQIMSEQKFVVAAVLDKPIWWGHNQVQVVFLISLTQDDANLDRFYKVVCHFISSAAIVQALVQHPEYENMIHLLSMGD